MKLYLKYVGMQIRSQMEHRMSLFLLSLAQFFGSFGAFLSIYFLLDRFGNIDGWTMWEVALCYGVTYVAFALCEAFCRGFDIFSRTVSSGDFDRLLLRPRGTVVQVAGSGFALFRIGSFVQGSAILIISVARLEIVWAADKIAALILMIAGGACVFAGIFILGATFCFFTIEGLEFINIFTHGGREMSSYPVDIYAKWIRRFFTFIIPFGCVNYLPLMYITGRAQSPLYMLIPLAGAAFLAPSIAVWHMGVRRYKSTGS